MNGELYFSIIKSFRSIESCSSEPSCENGYLVLVLGKKSAENMTKVWHTLYIIVSVLKEKQDIYITNITKYLDPSPKLKVSRKQNHVHHCSCVHVIGTFHQIRKFTSIFRYTSKYQQSVKDEYASGRWGSRTMGPEKVLPPLPSEYLKKHVKDSRLSESKFLYVNHN